MAKAASKDSKAVVVQREVLAALETHDHFADTGKTKKALNDAAKNLRSLAWFSWPVSVPAHSLLIILLTKDPAETLNHSALAYQMARKVPLESVLGELQQLVLDQTPPEAGEVSLEPSCRTPEVQELAQAIYRERDFQRMPELAEALQRAGCERQDVLEHCRSEAVHIRGCWVLDAILGDWIAKPTAARLGKSLKRHQILGRELFETRENTLKVLSDEAELHRQRTAPGEPHQQFARAMQLESLLSYAVLEHLGYGPLPDLPSRLHAGVDRAVEYFYGNWWAADEDDARALDKSRPDRQLRWFEVLPNALLLCGLAHRWSDAETIARWFDERVYLEPRFEHNDYEYQWLYLCVVAHLRPEPLNGLDVAATLAALKQGRPKRPRLLAALWQAILTGDEPTFQKALKESLRHFLSAHAENAPNVNFWVARDESLLCLIAGHQGLQLPALPENLDAALVRRQTIGLSRDS